MNVFLNWKALCIVFLSGYCCAQEPAATKIVSGPWLQAATETSIVVMWETNVEAAGTVEFGPDKSLGQSRSPNPLKAAAANTDGRFQDDSAIIHEVKLTGLNPGERYYYRVRSEQAVSKTFTLHTNRQQGPFTFVTTSNTHAFERSAQRRKMHLIAKIPVDFVINQGDQTQQSMNNEYRKQIQGSAASSTSTVWYTTRGNHENRPWSRYTFWYNNEFPGHKNESYYSFDVGNIHFVVLDEALSRRSFPKQWLEQDLKASTKKWKVVLAKKPPHLFGKNYLYDIFRDNAVDIMLCADCGTRKGRWPQPYEGLNARYRDVWYLTNCGGYQVVKVGENTWTVETYDETGKKLETTRITKD